MHRLRLGLLALVLLPLAAGVAQEPRDKHAYDPRWESEAGSAGCVKCHRGIEEIHPAEHLTCVACHGGDGTADKKEKAHVQPKETPPNDERVLPVDYDLKWQRFQNPSNLRVVKEACGDCHANEVRNVPRSLHGTTAGHLNDGLYENGVSQKKRAGFAIFHIEADPKLPQAETSLKVLAAIPAAGDGPRTSIATHYKDVPRKACMRCHLWGKGRAVRGRLGLDGDYRSEGCAACHVPYAQDGLSRSKDREAAKFEPGHPQKHVFTNKIATENCTHCHYGDASIGLHFQGMAQLVPGMPAGPRVPGTTERRLNGTYYIRDEWTPPDVHHEKGLACVDCHTGRETMGDGQIPGFMEHGLEVRCESCHGTFEAPSSLQTSRGAPLKNLRREGETVFLVGRTTGKRHPVAQAKDVIAHNGAAAKAMTKEHARLACWACHASWNVNFFGFHLDRHEGFTQLDQISGRRTTGRVQTLEKVFATFRQLTLGWDSLGRVSTYLVGFSTMCTVRDREGRLVLDEAMPETAAGLSGMTMIHHQVHTVRKRARECAECHRSPTALGLGSPSFELARRTVFAATDRGLEAIAFDRRNPQKSVAREAWAAPSEATRVSVLADHIQGLAKVVAVAVPEGVVLLDGKTQREVDRVPVPGARGFAWLGRRHLVVAAGKGGLAVVRLPGGGSERAKVVGRLALPNARDVALGFRTAYVADQEDGLVVCDLDDPAKPRVVAKVGLSGPDELAYPRRLALAFQFSRVRPDDAPRTKARHLAFVACGTGGLRIVDVTEPARPEVIARDRPDAAEVEEVRFSTVFDLGSEGGGIPSRERDYVYLLAKRPDQDNRELRVIDVDDPLKPARAGTLDLGPLRRGLALAHVYVAPFLQHLAIAGSPEGADVIDVTRRGQPAIVARLKGEPRPVAGQEPKPVRFLDVAVEAMPLDRMIDEDGLPLKDISHPNARYLSLDELRRVLGAKIR